MEPDNNIQCGQTRPNFSRFTPGADTNNEFYILFAIYMWWNLKSHLIKKLQQYNSSNKVKF